MGTVKSMRMGFCWLILVGALAAPAMAADDPPTELYVRTDPAGAKVFVDGKELGTSPGLFEVGPGVARIVVNLEGHDPQAKEVEIRAARITRIELRLKPRAAAQSEPPGVKPDQAGAPSFGPVVEQSLKDPEHATAELLDLDTDRRAVMEEFGRNDRQTHQWIREHGMDVLGARDGGRVVGLLLFDVAIYENPSIRWNGITAEEVARHQPLQQTEPKTINTLVAASASELPKTCLFRTREGGTGVLQLVAGEGSEFVKIHYKLLQAPVGADKTQRPRLQEAKVQIALFKTALDGYCLDLGDYPTTPVGLGALIARPAGLPDQESWKGPYLKDAVPLDPWGHPYHYAAPGSHNPKAFDLWSMGPDGRSGTEDDLGNW